MISVSKRKKNLQGKIKLVASKSESNRALIIRALCGKFRPIKSFSTAEDTHTLWNILQVENLKTLKKKKEDYSTHDVGAAGTTMRFLTAYFAIKPGIRVLTGSERMKQRPISILVDALKTLGAKIEYLEKKGYPPLKIEGTELKKNHIDVQGDTSSQYISALLLIAPMLPGGLKIKLIGKIVSWPYINMTVKIMEHFGAIVQKNKSTINVAPTGYKQKSFTVEADWSAASYWYSAVALSDNATVRIEGLKKNSLQGDAALVNIYKHWGVKTKFNKNGISLSKVKRKKPIPPFQYNFSDCPDIAQTVAVTAAFSGVRAKFSGLETLSIKETDRVKALQKELGKFGVKVSTDAKKTWIEIKNNPTMSETIEIETYKDHRMAMAFAPAALVCGKINIKDPGVVNKSYPAYWTDLKKIGFIVK